MGEEEGAEMFTFETNQAAIQFAVISTFLLTAAISVPFLVIVYCCHPDFSTKSDESKKTEKGLKANDVDADRELAKAVEEEGRDIIEMKHLSNAKRFKG